MARDVPSRNADETNVRLHGWPETKCHNDVRLEYEALPWKPACF